MQGGSDTGYTISGERKESMKRDNKKELDKDKKACWLKEAIKIDKGKQP